jgi:WS/DGAT/MGAT family acyltransferase
MHIGSVTILEPPDDKGFDFEASKRFIESRLNRVRTTRERVVHVPFDLGFPYWIEDPDFNIDFSRAPHGAAEARRAERVDPAGVPHLRDPAGPDTPTLGESRSLKGWRRFPGVQRGAFALVSKVHHAAIDGVSGAEMLGALFDTTDEPPPDREPAKWAGEAVPGPRTLLAKSAVNALLHPMQMVGLVPFVVKAMVMGTAVRQLKGVELPVDRLTAPRTRFNTSVTPHRNWGFAEFDLTELKALKSRLNVTVNDLILAICAGGLRRYLMEKAELPKESLVAMLPVNIRDEDQADTQGNKVSAMLAALATNVADPGERLQQIHKNTTSSKIYHRAVGAKKLSDMANFVPFSLGGLAMRLYTRMQGSRFHAPAFNTIITNVPGPQRPLYMNGARIVRTLGMGPITESMGLIHVVLSYDGHITIGVTTCREMLPDIDVYTNHLSAAYDELRKLGTAERTAEPSTERGSAKSTGGSKRSKQSRG